MSGVAAGAAVGEKKFEEPLEDFGVGGVAEKSGFTAYVNEVFGFEFVEVVRECGIGDVEFLVDFAGNEAFGMSFEEKLKDAQASFSADGREHSGVFDDQVGLLDGFELKRKRSHVANNRRKRDRVQRKED